MGGISRRLIVVAGVALAAAGCDRGSAPAAGFKSIDITGADYAKALDLADADGRQRSLADFKGKVTVVFFGYTQCPDVCPTMLADLARARQLLGADGSRVQVVFVTVDPDRDTPAVLKAYVGSFGSDFVALRGDAAQTTAAARQFKVFFSRVPGKTAESYTVDHTAGAYVFDPEGRIRLFARHGSGAESLAADLRTLLAEKSNHSALGGAGRPKAS